MLDFLSCLEKSPLAHKPTVHLIVNCGFLEPRQNEVAIDMLKLFCRKNGFPFGSSLSIGSGEAILQTPFALFVKGSHPKAGARHFLRQDSDPFDPDAALPKAVCAGSRAVLAQSRRQKRPQRPADAEHDNRIKGSFLPKGIKKETLFRASFLSSYSCSSSCFLNFL